MDMRSKLRNLLVKVAERTEVSRSHSTQVVATVCGRAEHEIGIEHLGVQG